MTIAGDRVSVRVIVHVPPDVAFEVFTQEIDLWWRRGPAFRVAGNRPGVLALEPRLGGRLFEEYDGPSGRAVREAGRVTAWEPPSRLALEWRGANFAPGEVTYIDVAFRAVSGGTEVALVHRGFAALRPDHPVRHGQDAVAFIRRLGLWWGQLLGSYRERVARE